MVLRLILHTSLRIIKGVEYLALESTCHKEKLHGNTCLSVFLARRVRINDFHRERVHFIVKTGVY
jgi:hypothetical protein